MAPAKGSWDPMTVIAAVVERMAEIASDPQGAAGRRTGLPRWLIDMVERLPIALRKDPLIARGLALAHHWHWRRQRLDKCS